MKKCLRWCLAALVVATLAARLETVGSASTITSGNYLYIGSCQLSDNSSYSLCGHEFFGSGFYGLSWSGVVCSIGLHYYWDTAIDASCASGYGSHSNQQYTAGSNGFAVMQSDGNFVLYNAGSTALWATNTNAYGSSAFLNLQNDGNLVVYYNTNVPVWSIY